MSPLVQELLVYAAVVLAGGWLVRRWLRGRSASTCDRCGPQAATRVPRRGIKPRSLRVLR